MLVAHSPIYVANFVTDMRKSINGLTLLAEEHFNHNPTDGAYYLFCNRNRDKIKILYWDQNGFALWYKRLEKGRFKLRLNGSDKVTLTPDEFQWLLSGLDPQKTKGRKALNYTVFQ